MTLTATKTKPQSDVATQEQNGAKDERYCLECGEKLGAGREDRKYCNDACRTSYNNRKKKAEQLQNQQDQDGEQHFTKEEPPQHELSVPDYIQKIQDILVRNRQILADACEEQEVRKMKLRDLIGRGFNTKFFTSQADPTILSGNIYRFCFEYGYREIDDDYVILIQRPREVVC